MPELAARPAPSSCPGLSQHPHDLVALEGLDAGEPVARLPDHLGRQVRAGRRRRRARPRLRDDPAQLVGVARPAVVASARARGRGERRPRGRARCRAAWRASGRTSLGPLAQRGDLDDGVDQRGQRRGDVVEPLGGHGEGQPARLDAVGARPRSSRPAAAARRPRRAARRRRTTTTAVWSLPSSGVHSASQRRRRAEPGARRTRIRSRGQARRTACASNVARPAPGSPTAATTRPAAQRAARPRDGVGPRRRRSAGCPAPGSSRGARRGTPRRGGAGGATGRVTGRASAPRCCRPRTGRGRAAGRWTIVDQVVRLTLPSSRPDDRVEHRHGGAGVACTGSASSAPRRAPASAPGRPAPARARWCRPRARRRRSPARGAPRRGREQRACHR